MNQDDELLTEDDVARLYKVDRSTILRWEKSGRFPAAHVRRHRFTRWRKSDVMRNIEQMATEERKERVS